MSSSRLASPRESLLKLKRSAILYRDSSSLALRSTILFRLPVGRFSCLFLLYTR